MKKRLYAIILMILILITIDVSSVSAKKDSSILNNISWQYRIGDSPIASDGLPTWTKGDDLSSWTPYKNPGNPIPNSNSSTVWVKATLPEASFKEPSLFFLTFNQVFEAYIDGNVIYSFGNISSIKNNISPGSAWHFIPLPDDFSGKTIYIRMNALTKDSTGKIRSSYIGSKSSLIMHILTTEFGTDVIIILFIFIGISSLAFAIIGYKRWGFNSFLYLGLSAIIIGLWLLSQTNSRQFLSPNPILWLYVSVLTLYVIPIVFCLFTKYIINRKFSRLLDSCVIFITAFSIISTILNQLNILPFVLTLNIFHALLAIIALILIVIVFACSFKGSLSERLFALSFILLGVLCIIDVIRWSLGPGDDFMFYSEWGMLALIITMLLSLIYQMNKSLSQIKLFSQEIRLKEEILEEKKKLLTEALEYDRMKTEFFVNISHELRTPLNIILGSIQLVNMYVEKENPILGVEKINASLGVMKQNCYRLTRLVNNILDITKLDTGYMEPFLEKADIVAVIEDTAMSVADYMKSKDLQLIFDTNVEEKFMCFDLDKIERILLNLLSNAIKFSNAGSYIEVTVLDKGEAITITVKDNGIGIPQDKLESVFERFVQVDNTLTRSHEGSGIGLSLVKSLAELHKGSVSVKSTLGKGSEFIVTLPATLTTTFTSDKCSLPNSAGSKDKISVEFSDI